jgi:hypothetical protein
MKNRKTFLRTRLLPIALLMGVVFNSAFCQKRSEAHVDKNGIIRWGGTNEEVKAFGINYTAMFAHAYRTAKKWNVPIEKAIDDDVYHFARLGFDAFRVHVWDTEISDTVGNLLVNDNLKLFDYTLNKMKERGMKFIITPIAYWGNGWPERDEKTPGFSAKYGKGNCLTDPGAIKVQERYLAQFVNHVNSYTGVAYKNDPDIIAFEISNEPHHNEAPEVVTAFINRMVKAIRSTGSRKPVFYNISHSIHLADAYFKSDIQGGTFQWYPTNLGSGHELKGNFLRNVESYKIPFADNPRFKKMAKVVYEFDAADIGRSYIYPAIARSFRTAGMQIATHFAYDPTFMAHVNTEYGTHFMNLVYAPQKALSLMIAGEVFHRVPMYQSFGQYPANTTFDQFKINYENDLAELISDNTYLYTNNSSSKIPNPSALQRIAGSGNSSIVHYEGTGAYFLDKLEDGVWRFEVLPDAIWIKDPFGKTSLKKTVAVVQWKQWPVYLSLPDLGENFSIKVVNEGNSFSGTSSGKNFKITPGVYMLVRKGKTTSVKPTDRFQNIVINEFAAPKSTLKETLVQHTPANQLSADHEYRISAKVFSPDSIESVEVYASAPGSWMEKISTEHKGGYLYEARLPSRFIKEGFLKYHVVIRKNGQSFTYPSQLQTHPWDWDFYDVDPYVVPVVKSGSALSLFSPLVDEGRTMRPWIKGSSIVPIDEVVSELRIPIEKLFVPDPENRSAQGIYDYSMQVYIGDKLADRKNDAAAFSKIELTGHSLSDTDETIQVALVTKGGDAFGALLKLDARNQSHAINLADFKMVKLVSLPRPYPTFLSYFVDDTSAEKLDLSEVEFLQISIGPGISGDAKNKSHNIAIQSVTLTH